MPTFRSMVPMLALVAGAGCGRIWYDGSPGSEGPAHCDGGDCELVGLCGAGGGSRDTSFGIDGTGLVEPVFGASDDVAWALAVQGDGKLLAAGRTYVTDHFEFAVARFDPDGAVDSSFGTAGQSVVRSNHDFGYAIAVQDDGKIVVGGDTWNFGRQDDLAYVRLDANGTLDPSFGVGGELLVDFGNTDDTGRGIAIADDGRIVIAATPSYDDDNADFGLVRTDALGILDPSFGTGGQVRSDFGGGPDGVASHHRSLVILPDGAIIVVGWARTANLDDFAVAKYTSSGVLDTTFDGDGRVVTDFGGAADRAMSLAIAPDGKLLVAGYATLEAQSVFSLARYESDGALDTEFGDNGRVTTAVPGGEATIGSVALTPGGEILVAGAVGPDGARDVVVARYCSDGALDTSFGSGGFVVEDLNGQNDEAYDLLLQPGGGVVLLAQTEVEGLKRFILLRVLVQ